MKRDEDDDDRDPDMHRPAGVACVIPGCAWAREVDHDPRAELFDDLTNHLLHGHPPRVVADHLVGAWRAAGKIAVPTLRPVVPAPASLRAADLRPKHVGPYVAPPPIRLMHAPGAPAPLGIALVASTPLDAPTSRRVALLRARGSRPPRGAMTAARAILAFLGARSGTPVQTAILHAAVLDACGPRSYQATTVALAKLAKDREVRRVAHGVYQAI